MTRPLVRLLTTLLVVVVGIGCTTTDRADDTAATTGSDPNIATGRSSSDPDSEPESPGHEPGRAPGQELEDEPSGQSEVEPAPHPISVRGLIETDYDGRCCGSVTCSASSVSTPATP